MTLAALYARVSSDRQRQEQTIASQTAALREHAAAAGLEVPPGWVFEDDGFSGATLVRPALETLRDLVAAGSVDVVVCHAPDRLARKYAYQALLIEEFSRAGTEVAFVKGPTGDSPEDHLLVQFQGMIAEYERAQIAERTRRGRLHRARTGSVNVLTAAPYGYRYVRKTNESEARYEVVPAQAAVVAEVFSRYATGELSLKGLSRWLAEAGVPTATGKAVWNPATLLKVLKNPAYRGQAAFLKRAKLDAAAKPNRTSRQKGRHHPADRRRVHRPPEEWIWIPVPPIVSEDLFAQVQARLVANKRFSARNTKVGSLLQGLVVCRECGYAYLRATQTHGSAKCLYYRCSSRHDPSRHPDLVCRAPTIRQEVLDEAVWHHVVGLLAKPELVTRELERRLAEARRANPATVERSRLEQELARVTAGRDRLVGAFQEDLITIDELRARLPDLRRREASLRTQLDAAANALLDEESYLRLAESLESFLVKLQDRAASATLGERQNVLRLIVREVLVGADQVVVRHTIPLLGAGPPPAGLSCRGQSGRRVDQ